MMEDTSYPRRHDRTRNAASADTMSVASPTLPQAPAATRKPTGSIRPVPRPGRQRGSGPEPIAVQSRLAHAMGWVVNAVPASINRRRQPPATSRFRSTFCVLVARRIFSPGRYQHNKENQRNILRNDQAALIGQDEPLK